jgi:hypothetical protein
MESAKTSDDSLKPSRRVKGVSEPADVPVMGRWGK